jgi:cytochrome b561
MTRPQKYPKAMIVIHWLTFILLAVIFYIGMTLDDYEFNEVNMNRYRAHALLGMAVMLLTIVRVIVKRKNIDNLPVEISYYSEMHKTFVKIVQKLIYILLIVTPMVGFIMVYQTGALSYDLGGPFPEGARFDETLEIFHKVFVFSLLILVVIHVAGIFMYNIKNKDNLIKRMCLLAK